ncbi:UNVERIFIED_CONTAM: putative germin-like protein 2-1 [Sesamum calycinum]|uniref:Germin-like protein 2-1 n=1 Tax=Sesamum calycinum TaxID=2727403 RepID=A0AAW2RWH0_9LAMI
MAKQIILFSLVALSFGLLAFAFEPSPLQDFCVADFTTSARVNGHACKNPASVQASDFSFSGLHLPGNTSNPNGSKVTPVAVAQLPGLNTLGISMRNVGTGNAVAIAALSSQNPGVITIANAGFGSKPGISSDILAKAFQWAAPAWKHIEPNGSKVTPVSVAQLPGLNTLGISMVRIDYAPWGINPPHTHPRATEILTVLEGSLQVGATWELEMLFAIAALSSQNPGVITIANAVFGSKPGISSDIIAKAFQVDKSVVYQLQAKF